MKSTVSAALTIATLLSPAAASAQPAGMEVVQLQSVNLRLGQCNVASIGGNIIAFVVDEGYQQQDLDGDHRFGSNVLVYRDITKDETKNTKIALGNSAIGVDGSLEVLVFPHPQTGTLAVFAIRDTGPFKRGLNDTGVPIGNWSWDGRKVASHGRVVFAAADGNVVAYDLLAKVTTTIAPGSSATISGSSVAFVGTGGTIQHYDLDTGTLTDTGAAGRQPITDGTGIVFQSQTDRSLAYYDMQSGQVTSLGFQVYDYGFSNGQIFMLANEDAYWGDLNGDGVVGKEQSIGVIYDVKTGRLVNTRVETCCGGDVDGGVAVFDVWEGQVGYDLIGDGYDSDCVQHFLDFRGLLP